MGIKQMVIPECASNRVSCVDVPCEPILDEWDLSFERPEDQVLFEEFYDNPHQASATFAGACTITGRPVRQGEPSRQVSYFMFAATIQRDLDHSPLTTPLRIADNELRNHAYAMYADARSRNRSSKAVSDHDQGRFSVGWYEPLLPAIG